MDMAVWLWWMAFQPISGFQISEFGISLPLPAIPKESLDEHRFSTAVPATPDRICCCCGHLPAADADRWFDGSMVCFKAGDWGDMVEASLDQDGDAATRLVESGKC